MRKSWPEERQEIAMWLSGYLSMYKKWVDRILDNDDHDVTKNKIIDLLSEWIAKLEEEKLKIMKMSDTPPEVPDELTNVHGDDDYAVPTNNEEEDI
jgi:hypothetical protein